ncbi:MAG: hypothetical protein UY62_C0047G0003 [Parcubacteria group bacterium GW2011_GWF2_50_9]|nr:MAG: hypothetical protein UY62_C0047G0003 [Parcubacteria group bacterium GW2011_GWF2_50_9]
MNTMDSNFFFLSCERPLGYPNAQISPAKSSSLVDNARIASSRFAFFVRNLSVCLSHYY